MVYCICQYPLYWCGLACLLLSISPFPPGDRKTDNFTSEIVWFWELFEKFYMHSLYEKIILSKILFKAIACKWQYSWSSLQISAWQLTMIVCKKFHADFRKSVSLVRADSPLHESASFHSKPVCKGRKAEYAKNVQWEISWLDQFSGCASQSKQCNERLDVRQICEAFFYSKCEYSLFW